MARRKGLTFYEKKKWISREMIRDIFSTLFCCFAAVLVAFVLVFSMGMKISVIGVSMEPVFYSGYEVLVNRFLYKMMSPQRGDVIVFLPNGNPNSHYYLKRVVGLPGEKIQIVGGYVYIDGELLEEDESYDMIADAGIAETENGRAKRHLFRPSGHRDERTLARRQTNIHGKTGCGADRTPARRKRAGSKENDIKNA